MPLKLFPMLKGQRNEKWLPDDALFQKVIHWVSEVAIARKYTTAKNNIQLTILLFLTLCRKSKFNMEKDGMHFHFEWLTCSTSPRDIWSFVFSPKLIRKGFQTVHFDQKTML